MAVTAKSATFQLVITSNRSLREKGQFHLQVDLPPVNEVSDLSELLGFS